MKEVLRSWLSSDLKIQIKNHIYIYNHHQQMMKPI
jgi:hypothetical protein